MLMNIELPALCFQTRHVVQPATGAQEKHQISTPFKTEKNVTRVDFDTKCNAASYDITVLGQTSMLKENFTKQGVRTTMFMLWKACVLVYNSPLENSWQSFLLHGVIRQNFPSVTTPIVIGHNNTKIIP